MATLQTPWAGLRGPQAHAHHVTLAPLRSGGFGAAGSQNSSFLFFLPLRWQKEEKPWVFRVVALTLMRMGPQAPEHVLFPGERLCAEISKELRGRRPPSMFFSLFFADEVGKKERKRFFWGAAPRTLQ